jgi:hypothetical protein
MLLRLGYDIRFEIPSPIAIVAQQGTLRLSNSNVLQDPGFLDFPRAMARDTWAIYVFPPCRHGFQRVVLSLPGRRCWTFDARHNQPRYGRVLMATGRNASVVAMTTSFGMANLTQFTVVSEEVSQENAFSAQNFSDSRCGMSGS